MKAVGGFLLVLGVLSLAGACINVSEAPNISYLVGTLLPGLACLIVGLKLQQTKKRQPDFDSDNDDHEVVAVDMDLPRRSILRDNTRADALKFSANLGIGCGILLMFLGGAVARQGGLLVGLVLSFAGCAWEIWGCVNYMRWKGHSGWFGLFGYFLLPGLLILACFPNRRKRLLQEHRPEQIATEETISTEDRSSGYRFLLTLVPLGVIFLCLGGILFLTRSNIDAAEWKQVAPPGIGFQALMPGTPHLEQQTTETPAGKIEIHKFTVEPKGKKELFMIMSIQFPEALSRELGGTEKLLELGRKDLLSASQGQVQSEQQIIFSGCPALEMEILPPKGAIIKARIYAAKNRIYQVSVHVPKIRLPSEDVLKFFNSFQLLAEPDAVADRPRD